MIQKVVSRARRRLLWNALAAAAAHAAIAGLVALILLLAGADQVSWRWIAVAATAVFAASAYLVFRRRPSPYAAARRLDERLGLADTLSTAVFYWPVEPPKRCDDRMRLGQRERAMQAAESADVRAAIPIRIPRRSLAAAAALLLIASAVLMVRYRLDYRIDLRASAGAAIRNMLRNVQEQIAAIEHSLKTPPPENAKERAGKGESTKSEEADDRRADADPSRGNATASREEAQAEPEKPPERKGEQQPQSADSGRDPENRRDSSSQDGSGSPRQDSSPAEQSAEQSGSNSSLAARLSDAFSKLASALKSASSGNPQRAEGQARTAQAKQRSGDASQESDSGSASRSDGQEGNPQGSNGGDASAHGSEQAKQKQAGSGAGSENGNKEIREAEQLEAMGKISVIFGKRSKELTGEVYTQVTSGPQQLSTPYVPRAVEHTDTHARASRDEIPLGFQEYVERYFQELRAGPASAPVMKPHNGARAVKR